MKFASLVLVALVVVVGVAFGCASSETAPLPKKTDIKAGPGKKDVWPLDDKGLEVDSPKSPR